MCTLPICVNGYGHKIIWHIFLQKWLNALTEHIAFSTHYTHQGLLMDEDREEVVPLGTMKDTLQVGYNLHFNPSVNWPSCV